MAAILIGNSYVGLSSQDPGAVGYGYYWDQTDTGNLYKRNTTNTGWTLVGNSAISNLGLAPISGFAATGGITGSHGLMPTTAASPFTNTPNVNGTLLALVSDITNAVNGINATINAAVQQAIASMPTASVNSNIARWRSLPGEYHGGVGSYSDPIILPITGTYADGTHPQVSECTFFPFIYSMTLGTPGGAAWAFFLEPGADAQTWYCWSFSSAASPQNVPQAIGFTAFAVKSNA